MSSEISFVDPEKVLKINRVLIGSDNKSLNSKRLEGKISGIEYRNELAKMKGYKDRIEYLDELARKKGFKDRNEYDRNMYCKSGKHTPFSENKICGLYLGVYIAERILPLIFEDVEKMSHNNPGYDYICNKGHKIDVKSSSLGINNQWMFHINRNEIANYFLIEAFDNRYDLNIMYIWLMKGDEVIGGRKLNDRTCFSVTNGEKHLKALDKYKITNRLNDIQKVCDEFKKISKE